MVKKNPFFSFFNNIKRKYLIKYSFFWFLSICLTIIYLSKKEYSIYNNITNNTLNIISQSTNFLTVSLNKIINIPKNITDYISIKKENDYLKQRNELLESYYISYLQSIKENENLKKLLNYNDNNEYHFVTSRISLIENGIYSNIGTINVGNKNSIKQGMTVVNYSGLVGRIINVSNNISQVMFITDINSKIPVISIENRVKAIITGNNTRKLSLSYLPEHNNLKEGEIIITSGDGGMIPYNIPVGVVKKDIAGFFYVLPFVDIDKIEYVKILHLNQ